jgi:hypothetical protein
MLGITIVLYFTVIFGMLFQMVLGAFQVSCGVLLLFHFKKFQFTYRNGLFFYILGLIMYLFFWRFGILDQMKWEIAFIIIPAIYAIAFTVMVETLKLKTS